MKDKIFMILLGIIAVNLTIQTVKDVSLFPTAYADVAGLDRYDLRRDTEFRNAVEYIVERRCNISGSSIQC